MKLSQSVKCLHTSQGFRSGKLSGEEFVSKLLDRRWTLQNPETKIHQIMVSDNKTRHGSGLLGDVSFSNNICPSLGDRLMEDNNQTPSFYVVRDDLLHPLVNGNKARKLDALFPLLEDHLVTDVVTCGGCQSAHAAAVAVSCAERGLKCHLLLRGEQLDISTGYNLISTMYGDVTYVPRSLYAKREEMLKLHADKVAETCGSVVCLSNILESCAAAEMSGKMSSMEVASYANSKRLPRKVAILNEGMIRLVKHLSQTHLLGKKTPLKIVVDCGTGTTAVGLGLGAMCLGLPWEIIAVMLAGSIDGYRMQERRLMNEIIKCSSCHLIDQVLNRVEGGVVQWVERNCPRKFGNILKGEVEACQQIARQTGILVDPVYTLAAWEFATLISKNEDKGGTKVVMLHTGGTLGMFGLAQRYKSFFHGLTQ
ncbi:Pyridoxal-phosphate dependent enzyme [Dillenia turbinata]|uniref:Pyridoxal-phosphate dependent enzyme n=1 Tax=Dillenia turbinata TaxID=194707 RepID=A0AAN8V6U1_9MAGN